MKGNKRIGVTAEVIASLRGGGEKNRFQSIRGRALLYLARSLLPAEAIEQRQELSSALRQILYDYEPQQVVELASGGSMLGFEYALARPGTVYIESDLPEVVGRKKAAIAALTAQKGSPQPSNHFIEAVDVLGDDIHAAVGRHLAAGRRTLVLDEGLTSYLDPSQYDRLVRNVSAFLDKIGGGSYLSHALSEEKYRELSAQWRAGLFLGFLKRVVGNDFYAHYKGAEEAREYFGERGFPVFRTAPEILGKKIRDYRHISRENPLMNIYMAGKQLVATGQFHFPMKK